MINSFQLSTICADNLGIGFFKYSLLPENKFISSNQTLVNLLEYPSQTKFLSLTFDDIFINSYDKTVFLKLLETNKIINSFEVALNKKNKKTIWVSITACYNCLGNNISGVEGIIQDITYIKNIQNKLLLEKDFLHGLFDNLPDAVYFKDRKNRIIKVNKFYTKGTGMTEKDVIGKTDFDFFPYEQARIMAEDDNYVLRTGKPIVGKIEKTFLPTGIWNQVITTKLPMYDKFGNIIGTMGTTRDMSNYANFKEQRVNMMINALEVLGKAMEKRDPYTFNHAHHVAHIAEEIAKKMGFNEDELLGIKLAAELHDLGKMSIPLDILNKPGKLSSIEYALIQEHVQNCYELIKDIDFPLPLAEITYQHHERLDGTGYPRKLKGDQILREARILAVSDVLEAMTHRRPYRESLGITKACQELIAGKGVKYDTEVVSAAINIIKNNPQKEFWLKN
ncbi:MAG: HD domain-containing protein [Candidatus Omnitrophica bacterium]|nr:HD domain-containing protein [Candidatus Omnitrophota bacterium]